MAVYFVQAGEAGPVKIGFAECVFSRMSKIQSDTPDQLRLLGVRDDGDLTFEAECHDKFKSHWMRGEWYLPAPELVAFAQSLGVPEKRRSWKYAGTTLGDYLASRQINLGEFAQIVGVSIGSMSRIIAGKQNTTLDVLKRIRAATNGEVSIDALIDEARL